jgi:Domain of unknown function (DUF4384)
MCFTKESTMVKVPARNNLPSRLAAVVSLAALISSQSAYANLTALKEGASDALAVSSDKVVTENSKAIPAIFTSLLANVVASGAQALTNRLVGIPANGTVGMASNAPPDMSASCYATPAQASSMTQVMRDELARAGCQVVAQFVSNLVQPAQPSSVAPSTVSTQPLQASTSVAPAYQALKVTVLVTNAQGKVIEERPVGGAFYTGEKFRLKVQSTFPGLLNVQHISPSGNAKRLFPRPEVGQFMIAAGGEVTLPLGGNVYEFANEAGTERLTFSVHDPRLQLATATGNVQQQETAAGSFYLQSVPNGQLPMISQTVEIMHRLTR